MNFERKTLKLHWESVILHEPYYWLRCLAKNLVYDIENGPIVQNDQYTARPVQILG